ncbi:MAG: GNAT family N-acetyltransferase [Actinomycetota bacterium]|nr:GNAT family N-acetyltransferase [Actinomycetota bacterium]
MGDRGVVELQTDFPGLVVREHAPADAHEYFELVQTNRDHLTRHGDYAELVAATRQETERRFAEPSPSLRCGIWKDERLIGHVSLVHGVPPTWGLGFWLAQDETGRGYMTASIAALLEYAERELMATEVLAGVTHGNHRSSRLLIRLRFSPIEKFPTYTRYRLAPAAWWGTSRSAQAPNEFEGSAEAASGCDVG